MLGLENAIQKSSDYLFRFSIGSNVMDQRDGVVDSLEELKSSRSVYGKIFPNFEMLDAKIADLWQSGGFTQTVTPTLTSQNGS